MIHTFNTGRAYSEHGQRVAYIHLMNSIDGFTIVAFYDCDRGLGEIVNLPYPAGQEELMRAYDACAYRKDMYFAQELQDALKAAAENHGKPGQVEQALEATQITLATAVERCEKLAGLCNQMFTMLSDLGKGYPWKELGISLDDLRERLDDQGVGLDADEDEEV